MVKERTNIMNCNSKNINTEYSNFPCKGLTIKERNFVKNTLDSIANCTHIRELIGTSAYITDPHKEFGLTNLRTTKINCAIFSPDKSIHTYNCYSYDLMLFVGANNAKIVNLDYDKVLIFLPDADEINQKEPTLILKSNERPDKEFKIYGNVIVAAIDWVTNAFTPLTKWDIKEITENFENSNCIYSD